LGVFAPDSETVSGPALRDVENLLPLYGSYRFLRSPTVASVFDKTGNNPVSGGFVHLVDKRELIQFARPDEDVPTPDFAHWRDNEGNNEGDGLYKAIDEAVPNDADYIFGGQSNGQAGFEVKLSEVDDPLVDTGHILRVRYFIDSPVDTTFNFTLIDDGSNIASVTPSSPPVGEWTTETLTLGTLQASSIANYDRLSVSFAADLDSDLQVFYPDEVVGNSGGWEGNDGGTDLHDYLGDLADDTEYITTPNIPAGGFNFWATVGLENPVDPDVLTQHKLDVRARRVTMSAGELKVILKEGDTTIATSTITLNDSFTTHSINFDSDDILNINDYQNLRITFQAKNTALSGAGTVEISGMELEMPQSGTLFISWVEFEVPSVAGAETKEGDVNIQYVGDDEELFELSDAFAWSEVGRVSNYGQGTSKPLSWDFTSWGDDVIATNYVDEIQTKGPTDSVFSDLITSPGSDEYEPRARFCTTINNFLVLADINPDSGGAGGAGTLGTSLGNPYTVWWSAINDNQTFKEIDLTTQSDYQPLRDTPGAITGLVGGIDYGLVFKRGSIIRMDYVGSLEIFTFDTISYKDGTAYPRSIVTAGSDVYFMGGGSIKRIQEGRYVSDIGDGQVVRWLTDNENNDEAMAQRSNENTKLVDSQIIGAYDPITRCIYWVYTHEGASDFNKERRILVYNTVEDRFTKLSIDSSLPSNTYISHIQTIFNTTVGGGPVTRLLQVFLYNPTTDEHSLAHFTGGRYLNSSFESNIMDSETFARGENVNEIQIHRVRPIFRMEGTSPTYPSIRQTITSSHQPEMSSTSAITVDSNQRSEAGWYPLDKIKGGEFYTFNTNIEFAADQLRYFTHWEVEYEETGER
jgi:hypothetical protein